jgi:glutathione S-transferase
MYTLYYSPGSVSMLVHLVLIECGAEHALEPVDLQAKQQHGAAYLALNPNGVVPTLVVDGQPYGEAAALAMLLAERHPQAALVPAPEDAGRAGYLQWMLYLANTVQPAFRQWFYAGEYLPDDAATIKEAARMRIEASWERVDAHLAAHGPYMLGTSFSVVDLFATMLMRWSRNMPRPATAWPQLAALAERVRARPSWKRMHEIEDLTEWS